MLKLAGVTYGTLNPDGSVTGGLVTTYAYDAAGNRARVARPNGTGTDYAYDTLNRLTDVTHRGPAGQVLFAQHYTLDADGRRTRDDETRLESNGTTSATTYTYVYDALGRLTAELVGPTGGQYDTTTAYYGYDRAGNRTFKADADPSAGPGFLYAGNNATYSYDARDRLTAETDQAGYPGDPGSTQTSVAYTYDANGSQAGRTSTATGTDPSTRNPTQTTDTDVSTYDARDRLAAVTRDLTAQHTEYDPTTGDPVVVPDATTHATVAYGYDDAGDRTSEVTSTTVTPAGGSPVTTGKTTYYLVDANNPTGYSQVVEEKGSPTGAPVISYAVGQEVLSQSDGATVLYLLPDGHGSTRLVTNAGGSILSNGRLDYDAWGNAVGFDPGSSVTGILYTGQRYDAAIGLYDLRARMYDPATGEFTSADGDQGLPDPLHSAPYLYTFDSPTVGTDPSGSDFELGSALMAASLGGAIDGMLLSSGGAISQSLPFFGDSTGWPFVFSPQIGESLDLAIRTGIGFLQGSAQGLANAANGLRNILVDVLNAALITDIPIMVGPEEPYNIHIWDGVPKPDWSYGLVYQEPRAQHDLSVSLAEAGITAILVANPWGRRGSPAHREKILMIEDRLTRQGWTVESGGSRAEVQEPTPYGPKYPDLVMVKGGKRIAIQVGRTLVSNLPVSRERANLRALRATGKFDHVIFIGYTPWK